ncbi:MAG: AMP-binding protein [Actinobacteria bacterium]|nr:AMP-binding protein [Actinomycetota bacterium]
MAELVALSITPGAAFLDALRRVWDGGDAVVPLDPGAPLVHNRRIVAALAPGSVIEADGERRSLDGGIPVLDGDALVIATSGTTGTPKGVVHTHAGIATAARLTATTPSSTGSTCWLACLPLTHVGGFSVITRALLNDATLVIHDRPDAARIDEAARQGATHVSLVTTLLGRIDASLWETILLGGSAIPRDRPSNAVATYGMTETFGGVVHDGRALDGVEVRIDEPDEDGVGVIELRTPTLMRSYRGTDDLIDGNDAADARDPDRWYRTGDLGSLSADEVLDVAGRSDDLIVTGAVKVWPTPVEEVLRRHPGVADVAVLGTADAEWGQRVVAVVVPSDPGSPPTLGSLRDHVRAELPAAAAPKELRLADVLPRTSLGKLTRHTLRSGSGEAGPIDDN